MSDDNGWTDEWDEGADWSGGGAKSKRLARAEQLGATVYELGPGNFAVYHFHHAAEELLVVIDGEGTCRYLMVSTHPAPEGVEYPELGQIRAQGPSGSQTGDRLWLVYD